MKWIFIVGIIFFILSPLSAFVGAYFQNNGAMMQAGMFMFISFVFFGIWHLKNINRI